MINEAPNQEAIKLSNEILSYAEDVKKIMDERRDAEIIKTIDDIIKYVNEVETDTDALSKVEKLNTVVENYIINNSKREIKDTEGLNG